MLQHGVSYGEMPETFALLKIPALGNRQVAQGRVKPAAEVGRRLRRDVALD